MNERALNSILSAVLLAVLLPACSSQDGLEERRLEAQRRTQVALRADVERGGTEEAVDIDALASSEASSGDEAVLPLEPAELLPDDPGGAVGVAEMPEEDLLSEALGADDEVAPPPAPARVVDESNPQDILGAMRKEQEAQKAEAQFLAAKGDAAFQANRFDEAIQFYRQALDKDPSLGTVRQRHHEAMMILNRREGEAPSIGTWLSEQEEVQRQLTLAEFNRNRDRAKDAFGEGEVDRAVELLSLALDQAKRNPEIVGSDTIKDVRLELETYERESARRAEQKRDQQLWEARRERYREQQDEREYTHRRAQDLLRKASTAIFRKDYHKAVEACEAVVKLDADNMVAKFWLRMARDQLFKQRQLKLIQDRIDNEKLLDERIQELMTPNQEIFVFPDDDYWARVSRRQRDLQTVEIQEPEPIRRMKARLETTPANVNFDETTLKDVIETFRTITGLNIHIDPAVDAESFMVTQRISGLPAMNALRLILEQHELGFRFEENMMIITSADQASTETQFDTYLVTDLLMRIRDFHAPEMRLRDPSEGEGTAPIEFGDEFEQEEEPLDADALIELIQEATGGDDVWTDENNIEYNQGQIFVNAPRELHAKIAEVLDNLRQDSDLFVVIEARFIDITDDFLEDIGIDSRALGIVNNLGEPFGSIINDSSTGGNDLGLVQDGSLNDIDLAMGTDRWAGRVQHIIDGFSGTIRGNRVNAGGGSGGGTFQATWLEPFQVNVILRAVQEKSDVRQLTAPMVTAHNNERVYVSVITQRAYIADYELVSGGTGFAIIEVADPVVQTFQEGVILDVDPTVSPDKKYVTLDVRPTLATLIGGVISTINISLGSFTNVAFQVPIGVPQIALQQSFTSVTVPNGGTVLLGGFNSVNEGHFESYLPILGQIPIVKNLARRKATISEKRSLIILLTARIVDLRGAEVKRFPQS